MAHSKWNGVACAVADCSAQATDKGMCNIHYGRMYRHGSTDSRVPGYGTGRYIHEDGYIRVKVGVGHHDYRLEHVVIAERALGKPLPKKAKVHHVNGRKGDNKTTNLVVCPDQKYHLLLHARQRALGITFP